MKRFLETKLFKLLSCSVNGNEIDRIELSMAYDDFVRQLLLFCQEEQNIYIIMLCYKLHSSRGKRIEYASRVEVINLHLKSGLLIIKVLSILDSTFKVIQFRLENPDYFR